MKYDSIKKKVFLEKKEINIVSTAIMELGGPFHSPLAKHLLDLHEKDLSNIEKELDATNEMSSSNVRLIMDAVYVFLHEPLDSDWGTIYDDISKDEVTDVLTGLSKIYEIQA